MAISSTTGVSGRNPSTSTPNYTPGAYSCSGNGTTAGTSSGARGRGAGAEAVLHPAHEFIRHDRLAQHARDVERVRFDAGSRHDHDRDAAGDRSRGKFLLDGQPVERAQDQIEDDQI